MINKKTKLNNSKKYRKLSAHQLRKNIKHKQIGGGGNICNLFNNDISCKTLAQQLLTIDTINAIPKFTKYIAGVHNTTTREQRYDIHFLTSIMSIIHNYNNPVIYNYKKNETTNTLTEVDANSDVRCCDETDPNRLRFFIEDIYTEDLNKFITEYDNFIKTKQSSFFYKSNVANIAILFKCYYKRCFDEYITPLDI